MMKEDIMNEQLNDDDLEQVNGGMGMKVMIIVTDKKYMYKCRNDRYCDFVDYSCSPDIYQYCPKC